MTSNSVSCKPNPAAQQLHIKPKTFLKSTTKFHDLSYSYLQFYSFFTVQAVKQIHIKWLFSSSDGLTLYLVSHMRLELKFCRWAKSCRVHLHEPLSVITWVQTVHCILYDVETLMAWCLKVVFSWQVGPQGPVQAGVVAQIAALGERKVTVRLKISKTSGCNFIKNFYYYNS